MLTIVRWRHSNRARVGVGDNKLIIREPTKKLKNIMKKFFYLIAATALLVACGGEKKSDEKSGGEKAKQEQTQQEQTQQGQTEKKSMSVADKAREFDKRMDNAKSEAEQKAIAEEMWDWYGTLNASDKKIVEDILFKM